MAEEEASRGEEERKEKVVMVAVDESEYSQYALSWALKSLRDSISKFRLIIFAVQPISDFGYIHASTFGAALPELINTVAENQRKTALALLERAKEICSTHGIVAETATEAGDPKEAICEAVEKLNVNLLVLGSHGRGALRRSVSIFSSFLARLLQCRRGNLISSLNVSYNVKLFYLWLLLSWHLYVNYVYIFPLHPGWHNLVKL